MSCATDREIDPGQGGVHPPGWADPQSASFHAGYMRDNGEPLAECKTCHGDDYGGGAVGVSCTGSGCHTKGVEYCGTCHGGDAGPRPRTQVHEAHAPFCKECHPVPDRVDSPGHINGVVDVVFAGQAVAAGAAPTWSAADKSCSGTYCHQDGTPTWDEPGPLGCDACHAAPPDSHAQFRRVAGDQTTCQSCHPAASGSTHVDGRVEVTVQRCDACHGSGLQGMPGPGLDGSTDPSSPEVGAHRAHVDITLGGRIGRAVPCATCHTVPVDVSDPGHIDGAAPADVILPAGGTYDATDQSCTVWCHFDRDPGPMWTDDSGDARQCDSCHGFPPVMTRRGTPHPPADPDVAVCQSCHLYSVETHVDGKVDFR